MTLWERAYLPEAVRGLYTTLRHVFMKKVTVEYPDEEMPIHENFRALHRLNTDDDGNLLCVACMLCATVCPANCITIVAGESDNPDIEKYPISYDIDMGRCIFCGFCEEACPKAAIELTKNYRLADYDRSTFQYDKEQLSNTPITRRKKE
jgi:NADH-quinone oxidoreductase subunit I